MAYYDRYSSFRNNGNIKNVFFVKIGKEGSDLYITYDKNSMRMDTLSYKYYNDANYGWLIMQSNPHFPSMEFLIPDGVTLRIPYPLNSALKRYEKSIEEYRELNGD